MNTDWKAIMKLTVKLTFIFFISFFCSFETYAQNSKCEQLKDNETTHQGYSELITFEKTKTFRAIRGKTVLGFEGGEPLENVFVEVFPHKSNKRITGCRTRSDGRFIFPNLEKGKYIIRLSKDGGFKITEIHVKISPKTRTDKEIIGFLYLGT